MPSQIVLNNFKNILTTKTSTKIDIADLSSGELQFGDNDVDKQSLVVKTISGSDILYFMPVNDDVDIQNESYRTLSAKKIKELIKENLLDISESQILDWKDSILSFYDPSSILPPNPTKGDRYISLITKNNWVKDYIYEYNGTIWMEDIPNKGSAVFDESAQKLYIYSGSPESWKNIGSVISHSALSGLSEDDHKHYLSINGRSGGQTIIGGINGEDNLIFETTKNPTKGKYIFPELGYGILFSNTLGAIETINFPTDINDGDATILTIVKENNNIKWDFINDIIFDGGTF